MRCKDCPYCYKTEEDDFACCHFEGADGWAPCEQEVDYEEEEEDEND